MSTSSKSKLLSAAVIILLLTNIAMLVFFFCCKAPAKKNNRGGGREAMVKEFLQKEIGFTAQQVQQYDTLSKQHREKIKASFEQMKTVKETMYKEIGSSAFSDSVITATAAKSSAMQNEMEVKMLLHFKDIRRLCTAEQQPKFDSLFYKIWRKRGQDSNKQKTKPGTKTDSSNKPVSNLIEKKTGPSKNKAA